MTIMRAFTSIFAVEVLNQLICSHIGPSFEDPTSMFSYIEKVLGGGASLTGEDADLQDPHAKPRG